MFAQKVLMSVWVPSWIFQNVLKCMQKCCMQHYLSGLSQMEFQVDNRHTCRRTCRAVTSQLKILGLGLALGNGNRVPLVPGDDSTYNLMLISAWNCSTVGLVFCQAQVQVRVPRPNSPQVLTQKSWPRLKIPNPILLTGADTIIPWATTNPTHILNHEGVFQQNSANSKNVL